MEICTPDRFDDGRTENEDGVGLGHGFMSSHLACGPPNSKIVCFIPTDKTLAISLQFIEGSVCPRTRGGKKLIMMIVSPSLPRHVENSMRAGRWGIAFFARRYLYVPRGVFSDGKKWSLVRCGLSALLCCNEAIAESVGRSELLASPP